MVQVAIAGAEADVLAVVEAAVDVVVAAPAVVAAMAVVTEAMAADVTKPVPENAKAAITRGLYLLVELVFSLPRMFAVIPYSLFHLGPGLARQFQCFFAMTAFVRSRFF